MCISTLHSLYFNCPRRNATAKTFSGPFQSYYYFNNPFCTCIVRPRFSHSMHTYMYSAKDSCIFMYMAIWYMYISHIPGQVRSKLIIDIKPGYIRLQRYNTDHIGQLSPFHCGEQTSIILSTSRYFIDLQKHLMVPHREVFRRSKPEGNICLLYK